MLSDEFISYGRSGSDARVYSAVVAKVKPHSWPETQSCKHCPPSRTVSFIAVFAALMSRVALAVVPRIPAACLARPSECRRLV